MTSQNGHWGEDGVGWWWDVYDHLLVTVIPEAVASMSHLETEWDTEKLEIKLREYFRKGTKNMEFVGRGMEACINEYADNVMASLFAGLGDREWLVSGQVDFLVVFDAAVKDLFPGKKMRYVKQTDFETWCLMAYSRAFDEQRIFPLLSEIIPTVISGPKLKRKVWTAVEEGRKHAVNMWPPNAEDFAKEWINKAVKLIAEESQGNPALTLETPGFIQLFLSLLNANALPMTYKEHPVPLEVVGPVVTEAYAANTIPDECMPIPSKKTRLQWGLGDEEVDFDDWVRKSMMWTGGGDKGKGKFGKGFGKGFGKDMWGMGKGFDKGFDKGFGKGWGGPMWGGCGGKGKSDASWGPYGGGAGPNPQAMAQAQAQAEAAQAAAAAQAQAQAQAQAVAMQQYQAQAQAQAQAAQGQQTDGAVNYIQELLSQFGGAAALQQPAMPQQPSWL